MRVLCHLEENSLSVGEYMCSVCTVGVPLICPNLIKNLYGNIQH